MHLIAKYCYFTFLKEGECLDIELQDFDFVGKIHEVILKAMNIMGDKF